MPGSQVNPHFFRRDKDGSVRLRLRFTQEEADIIEEGAGDTPLIQYIHRVLMDRANAHATKARKLRQSKIREAERNWTREGGKKND